MRLQETQNRINTLMTQFVTRVKGFSAMGRTDINKISETVLIPLLTEIYDYKDLINLNIRKENYPGIDLGDEKAKVAFQITATPDSTKIKKTLAKFVEYKLYEQYDRLIIYIITDKQDKYSGNGFAEIIQNKFEFNPKTDIMDYKNVLQEITNFQIEKAEKIRLILEKNFGNTNKSYLLSPLSDKKTEIAMLNLLEINFPDELYIGDLSIIRDQVIKESKNLEFKDRLNILSSWRDVVRAALKQKNLAFSSDWVAYGGKIITFHNLSNDKLPLNQIINKSSIKKIRSKDYFSHSVDQENVFKTLLNQCLKQQLFKKNVSWQHEEKKYIFSANSNTDKRVETWIGEKESTRNVCEKIMKKNNPNEIFCYKHFAFMTQFKQFGNNWFLLIKPDWFFSSDGYKKSYYHKDLLSWLKKNEKNKAVFNHFRFIVEFLKKDYKSIFVDSQPRENFLSFGSTVSFDNSPYLNDQEWLPTKVDSIIKSEELEQPKSSRRKIKKKSLISKQLSLFEKA